MPRIRDVCPGPGSSKFLVMVEHVFVWEGCSAKQSCFGPDFFFFFSFSSQEKLVLESANATSWLGVNKKKKKPRRQQRLTMTPLSPPDRFLLGREVHFLKIFLTTSRWKNECLLRIQPLFVLISSIWTFSRRFPSSLHRVIYRRQGNWVCWGAPWAFPNAQILGLLASL